MDSQQTKVGAITEERGRRPSLNRLPGAVRVWTLNVLLAGAAFTAAMNVRHLAGLDSPVVIDWWMVALAFYLGEIMVVHLQFKRDAYSFSLEEIALVLGLFFAAPADLLLGQLVGTTIAVVIHRRQSPMKGFFNIALKSLEASVAGAIFYTFITRGDALLLEGWGITFLATAAAMSMSILMVAVAISLSEGRLRLETMQAGFTYGSMVALTNTSLALVAAQIIWREPHATWLLLVPTGLLFLSYRAYLEQREKHESLEFLYESTRSVQDSLEADQAILVLLRQAREMFRAEAAQVTLFSEDDETLAYRTYLGPGDAERVMEEVDLHPHEGVWARVAAEGQAILLSRPIGNDRLRVHFAARGIYKDAMVAPLFGKEGVIGTIVVGDRLGDVSTFDSEDLKLFETLANHASVSLENARLIGRLRESLAHLTEMNRLKDDFVAAVSHELRTPLTSIQGYIKTLLRPDMDRLGDTEKRTFLESIDRASERLRGLIEDLLVVARLEAKEIEPNVSRIQLRSVADHVLVELRGKLVGREVTVDFSEDIGSVESDPGKVHQILSNLVENAAKYSPPETPIEVRAGREGAGVTISVRDQGPGIAPEEQDRVFERFYQVDQSTTRKVGGTGLGLYLCRRLAQSLGGRVWIESSGPHGSVFSLWLPSSHPMSTVKGSPEITL